MTSHVLGGSVDDTYDGIPDLGERLCAFISQPLEDYLWTGRVSVDNEDEPARYGLDPEQIVATRVRADAMEGALKALADRIAAEKQRRRELARARDATTDPVQREQLTAAYESTFDDIEDLQEERAALLLEWPDVKKALVDAQEKSRVRIPDDVSDEEWSRRVEEALGISSAVTQNAHRPLAGSLNFRRAGALMGVGESRVRQMHAETASGKMPRRLRAIIREGLDHDEIWDATRQNYDRRLLVSALKDPFDAALTEALERLRHEQALDDGLTGS